MVSQKSMLPRGARSDFLGKKNVSLPSSTYYFQQRRSLYSAQDKLWAWHTDKPETTWQPSTRTRVQTGPSKSEPEVKTSNKWSYRCPRAGDSFTFVTLANKKSGSQQVIGSVIWTRSSNPQTLRGLSSSKIHRPQGDGRSKFKLGPVSQAHPATEPPHLYKKTEQSLTEL